MRLSSLSDHAVVLMAAAARGCGCVKHSATSLAAETGVPLPTAQKLVNRLAAAHLIETSRGSKGGIRLARPPSAISLADIVEAVEGPIAPTEARAHMATASGAVRGALASVSLASLSAQVPA